MIGTRRIQSPWTIARQGIEAGFFIGAYPALSGYAPVTVFHRGRAAGRAAFARDQTRDQREQCIAGIVPISTSDPDVLEQTLKVPSHAFLHTHITAMLHWIAAGRANHQADTGDEPPTTGTQKLCIMAPESALFCHVPAAWQTVGGNTPQTCLLSGPSEAREPHADISVSLAIVHSPFEDCCVLLTCFLQSLWCEIHSDRCSRTPAIPLSTMCVPDLSRTLSLQ